MAEFRFVTAERDVDGAWRVIELKAGGHTDRFDGHLAGEQRHPSLDDLSTWLGGQGFVEAHRHEQGNRLFVTFGKQPGPATPGQEFLAWLQAQAQQDVEPEQPAEPAPAAAPEPEPEAAPKIEALRTIARQVVRQGMR